MRTQTMEEKNFYHKSVMPDEVLNGLQIQPDGMYLDCTLGGAGHSCKICEQLSEKGKLFAFDRDEEAIAFAQKKFSEKNFSCSIELIHQNFAELENFLLERNLIGSLDGILFDLGVSSHQIDTVERGFSYTKNAPLDMRMDTSESLTAEKILNTWSEENLTKIFFEYGEERWSKRIAQFIIQARQEKNLQTTGDLVAIIDRAIPKNIRREKISGHPAKRIFQALRIAVNDELSILEKAFRAAVKGLKPGGRLVILTFHSLEDREAKKILKECSQGCLCPKNFPVCVCHHQPEIKLFKKLRPTQDEIEQNPRAKSATLRIAEKI